MSRKVVAVILAAGRGTRMKSQLPKVLHRICGRPMLAHVLDAVEGSGVEQTFVVTGHGHDLVAAEVGARATCVLQREQLGTAHAVMMAAPHLEGLDGDVLICCGDTPLLLPEELAAIVERRRSHHTAAIVLTTDLDDPKGYGRIVRKRDGSILKIVEHKDANIYEERINEINTGVYCFDARLMLGALRRVGNQNAQREYYLPDVVQILAQDGHEIEAMKTPDSSAVIGVNSRKDMAVAEGFLRRRILDHLMAEGVTIIDPETTFIDRQVKIGPETVVHPFTQIAGDSVVGAEAAIGPHACLRDARVGDRASVRLATVEDATLGAGVAIGPYAVVRGGAVIPDGGRVAAFVEVVGDTTSPRGERVVLPPAPASPPSAPSAPEPAPRPAPAPAAPTAAQPAEPGLFPSGWRPDPARIPADVQRQLAEIAHLREERLKRRDEEQRRAAAPHRPAPAATASAAPEPHHHGDPVSPRDQAQRERFAAGRTISLDPDNPEIAGLERLVDTLLDGGVVALPADTSFVLMADATNRRALARLRAATGRAERDPAVVAVHSERMLRTMIRHVSEPAARLIDELWPGPLTLVFPRPAALLEHASPAPTIAVRQPDHTATLSIISMLERPIAVVRFDDLPDGRSAAHLAAHLGAAVDLVVDLPRPRHDALPSTVVDLTGDRPRVVRAILGDLLDDAGAPPAP